ncbi:MAG: cell division protein SepF [Armatimonadota bacterium]|nr:cell division protein SepF [Armatimonadota bacterium]
MNQNAEADYDEQRPRNGVMAKLNRFFGRDELDEDEEEDVSEPQQPQLHPQQPPVNRASGGALNPQRRGVTALRIEQTRETHITVRRAVHSFDDARRAADGLKDGQQQIVNLEQTPADMAERITDFLNGATYALEGSVEKIGEQVYLFTPNSVTIDVEDKPAAASRTSFIERE